MTHEQRKKGRGWAVPSKHAHALKSHGNIHPHHHHHPQSLSAPFPPRIPFPQNCLINHVRSLQLTFKLPIIAETINQQNSDKLRPLPVRVELGARRRERASLKYQNTAPLPQKPISRAWGE